jgi:hypothetical protein
LLSDEALIFQVLAFPNGSADLKQYMDTMERAGYLAVEAQLLYRTVPNRKWYADAKGILESAREFLLIHRPRRGTPTNGE